MKLILKHAVDDLGDQGEVVSVKPGYARNYLLPQGLAYEASEANLKRIEEENKAQEDRARRDYLEGRRRAAQLEGMSLTFEARASEEGKLYGSISPADITDRLNEGDLDFQLERKQVLLDEPLKEVG
ncbi:MAG: 50S ribosomal protein L9, partial [Gemmatimonadota bacterium]